MSFDLLDQKSHPHWGASGSSCVPNVSTPAAILQRNIHNYNTWSPLLAYPHPSIEMFGHRCCRLRHAPLSTEPPALRRRAATDKLITQAECHRDWPLYDDIFHPPPLRLESRKPLWDMQSIDVTSRWREDWQSATVVNSTLVVLW